MNGSQLLDLEVSTYVISLSVLVVILNALCIVIGVTYRVGRALYTLYRSITE